MPILELTAEMINAPGVHLTTEYIETVMLWPGDEMQRIRAMKASKKAQFKFEKSRLATGGNVFIEYDAELIEHLDAPQLTEVQNEAKGAVRDGFLAGVIFYRTLAELGEGPPGLQAVKKWVSAKLRQPPFSDRVSLSTLDNIVWRTYRPVAHLWAAHYMATHHSDIVRPGVRRRSSPIQRFLGISEALRLMGEQHRLRQSAETLLNPATTWRVSEDLYIPVVNIRWDEKPSPRATHAKK